MKKLKFALGTNSIKTIYEWYGWHHLNFAPEYQREFIWDSNFKAELILSILKGYPIGAIVYKIDDNLIRGKYEIIDGQQRLRTIISFIEGRESGKNVTFQGKHKKLYYDEVIAEWRANKFNNDVSINFHNKITKYEIDDKMDVFRKLPVKFGDMPRSYQQDFEGFLISCISISAENDKNRQSQEIAAYFRVLQNQDKLRAGEIMNAVPNSQFDDTLRLLKPLISKLSKKRIIFDDKRREFTKIFISIIGLVSNDLALGTTDKDITRYFENNATYLNITSQLKDRIVEFNTWITKLNNNDDKFSILLSKGWKRFIKLFLILYFNYNIDFNPTMLRKLNEFNKNLAIYASAKKDGEKQIAWSIEYDPGVFSFDEGFIVFDLCRGRKTLQLVEQNLTKLVDYIADFADPKPIINETEILDTAQTDKNELEEN